MPWRRNAVLKNIQASPLLAPGGKAIFRACYLFVLNYLFWWVSIKINLKNKKYFKK